MARELPFGRIVPGMVVVATTQIFLALSSLGGGGGGACESRPRGGGGRASAEEESRCGRRRRWCCSRRAAAETPGGVLRDGRTDDTTTRVRAFGSFPSPPDHHHQTGRHSVAGAGAAPTQDDGPDNGVANVVVVVARAGAAPRWWWCSAARGPRDDGAHDGPRVHGAPLAGTGTLRRVARDLHGQGPRRVGSRGDGDVGRRCVLRRPRGEHADPGQAVRRRRSPAAHARRHLGDRRGLRGHRGDLVALGLRRVLRRRRRPRRGAHHDDARARRHVGRAARRWPSRPPRAQIRPEPARLRRGRVDRATTRHRHRCVWW
mmetsp:Transcript_26600/g.106537  ORF Transcript_26600/g.106537 Transcript_26600/m.106537 type:complete len:317 (-) Transcript_26600:1751-2701(-)